LCFWFGSKGTENLGSAIDVLIIGYIDFTEIVTALYSAQTSLGREINPKTYSREEWRACLQKQELFNPKLFIMGAENGLG